MEETESFNRTLNATTEHMNDIVTNINYREIEIESKKRQLEKIKIKEIERSKHLQIYLEQLSSQSAALKEEETQFQMLRKEEDEKLSTAIQESIANIDKNIQTLKKMQTEKVNNEQEINILKEKITQFEEDLLKLEKKDLEAEKILYELVTRPFTNEEIKQEVQQSEKTDKDAVQAMLNLTLKTIYNLRQKITEEKKKRSALKDEFNTITTNLRKEDQINYENQLNQLNNTNSNKGNDLLLYYNPITGKVDMTQYNQVDSRVKSLKRRDKRIDKEMSEINSKKPQIITKFNEKKFSIEKINNEKQKYDSKLLAFKVDFNPDYNNALTSQINQIQTDKVNFERKLKKSKQKLILLENTENQLHKKLRTLTEMEIDAEQSSLKIASFANENHRIETENAQRENEELIKEQELVSELSDLQKEIATKTAEFDDMIQRHQKFENEILNDEDWQKMNLLPPELDAAMKHSNVSNFGLPLRVPEMNNFSFSSSSNSQNSVNSNSNFLTSLQGGFENGEGSTYSSYFSFTQSGKNESQKKSASEKKLKAFEKSNSALASIDSSMAKKIARMKQRKEKIRHESLKILAKVRGQIEVKEFAMKEIRVMQAKLHQESFNLQKLQLEASKKDAQKENLSAGHQIVRTSDEINFIKDRIQQVRVSNRDRRGKIDEKSAILHRIEKVSSYTNSNSEPSLSVHPNFIIQDGERVVDRILARRKLCQEADRKVEVAQDVLNGFCEFYQKLREELRIWYKKNQRSINGNDDDETDILKKWIELMQESCKRFRNCGI